MNVVILSGRLTREPEIRYTQGGMAIAKISIAVDRTIKKEGEPTADFINCIAFSKTAEFIEKYISKGNKVIINGRWQTGNYTDKNGNKVYTNDCLVNNIEPCEKAQKKPVENSGDGFLDVPDGIDEELPFN